MRGEARSWFSIWALLRAAIASVECGAESGEAGGERVVKRVADRVLKVTAKALGSDVRRDGVSDRGCDFIGEEGVVVVEPAGEQRGFVEGELDGADREHMRERAGRRNPRIAAFPLCRCKHEPKLAPSDNHVRPGAPPPPDGRRSTGR